VRAGFLATGALGLAAALALVRTVGGCGGGLDCTTEAVPSVEATVVDSEGNVVKASVAQVELEEDGSWKPCDGHGPGPFDHDDLISFWYCGYEQAGTLRVRRVVAGLEPQVQEVQVPEDECHVHTQTVRFTLPAGYTPPEPDPNGADAGATDASASDAGGTS